MSDRYRTDRPLRRDSDNTIDRYRSADNYRDPRSSRAGDIAPHARRTGPEAHSRSDSQDFKMDTDKAVSEISKLLRLRDDALVEKTKWNNRKDVVLEGYHRRLASFKKQGGSNSHEPSIAEAFERHNKEYMREKEEFDLGLAKQDAILKETTAEFSRILVKALPVNEIKERQLVDAVKLDLQRSGQDDRDRAPRSERQLATLLDDHKALLAKMDKVWKDTTRGHETQKLEEQMTLLTKNQEAQQARLDKLHQENEELRIRNASYEAQATDITALVAQQNQLRQELGAKMSDDSQLEVQKQENENVMSQVLALQTQLADLNKQVDSQNAAFPKALEKVTTDFSKSLQETRTHFNAASAHSTPPQELRTVQEEVNALVERIKKLDLIVSNFEPEEYTDAMAKVLAYPSWTDMKNRLQGQESETRRISLETKGLTSAVTNVRKDISSTETNVREEVSVTATNLTRQVSEGLTAIKQESDARFGKFSDKIVETCESLIGGLTTKVDEIGLRISGLETRISSLETRTAVASRASSAVVAPLARPINSALPNGNGSVVHSGVGRVQTDVSATGTVDQGLLDKLGKLRDDLTTLNQKVWEAHSAHEMMIMGLDEQFKNLTTVELASTILDNLKKLPTNVVPVDVQNFHERLADLELYRQEQVRRFQEYSQQTDRTRATLKGLIQEDQDMNMRQRGPLAEHHLELGERSEIGAT